eukprot:5283878-Pyramimonas_sp.AAC.1
MRRTSDGDPSEAMWLPVCGVAACLSGRRQTVPRSELLALALGLENSSGDIAYVCDCKPAVEGWRSGRSARPYGRNSDLW